MILSNWLKKRKQRIEQDLYDKGFDYALGAMARGEKAPLELDAEQIDCHRNQFDVGMDNAINYAIQHKLVKDNRTW